MLNYAIMFSRKLAEVCFHLSIKINMCKYEGTLLSFMMLCQLRNIFMNVNCPPDF